MAKPAVSLRKSALLSKLVGEVKGFLGRRMVHRQLLYLSNSGVSALTGLIIIRALSEFDYTIYQTMTKKVIQLIVIVVTIFELWILKLVSENPPDVAEETVPYGIIAGLVGLVSGIGIIYYVSLGDLYVALLAGIVGFVFGLRYSIVIALDSQKMRRGPAVRIFNRGIFFLLVLGAFLVGSLNVLLLLLFYLIGQLVGLGVALRWLGVTLGRIGELFSPSRIRSGLAELIRGLGGKVWSGLNWGLPLFILALDVPFAYVFVSDYRIFSFYFAARLVPYMLIDSYRNTFRILAPRVKREISTFNYENVAETLRRETRRIYVILAPIAGFTFVFRDHIMNLLNPIYLEASLLLGVFIVEAVFLVLGLGSAYILLGFFTGTVAHSDNEISALARRLFLPAASPFLIYIILLPVALRLAGSVPQALFLWGLMHLAASSLYLLLLVFLSRASYGEPGRFIARALANVILEVCFLMVISLAVGFALLPIFRPGPLPESLLAEIIELTERALAYGVLWMAVVLGLRRYQRDR